MDYTKQEKEDLVENKQTQKTGITEENQKTEVNQATEINQETEIEETEVAEAASTSWDVPDTATEKFVKDMQHRWKKIEQHSHYEDNPASYAYGINGYKMCWLFVCGSVMGYVAETVWYLYLRGHLVNRQGVLIGPFSPIYGIMFVLLTALLYKLRDYGWKRIFLISMASVTTFEYLCSFAMERILGTKSWTYKNKAFNLNGRVCLQMSIMWGILGLVYIKLIYPQFSRTIENFKEKWGKRLGIFLCTFLLVDCVFSIYVSFRQNERRHDIPPSNAVEEWIDSYYTDEKLASIYSEIRVVKKPAETIIDPAGDTVPVSGTVFMPGKP